MIYSTSRPTLLITQSNSDLKQSRYWLALKICYAQTHKPFHYYIDQDRISVIEFGKKLKIPDHLPFVSVISGTLTGQVIKNLNKLSDKEDLNKRKIEELEKAKIEAQEELKLATKKQKDAEDEKVTVIKIFECMRQLIDGGSVNIPVFENKNNSNEGAVKKYSCTQCGYQGENDVSLNQHKKDKHLQDLLVNYPCEC